MRLPTKPSTCQPSAPSLYRRSAIEPPSTSYGHCLRRASRTCQCERTAASRIRASKERAAPTKSQQMKRCITFVG